MKLVKQNLVLLIIIVLVTIGGVVYVLAGSEESASKSGGADDYAVIKACDSFKLDGAKSILGDEAAEGTNSPDAKSSDVNVSTCSYTNNAAALADVKIATVMVRSALSESGAQSNKAVFGNGAPDGAEKVEDFGDEAYFSPALGQLNVLEGNDWYVMSFGGTTPDSQTLDNAKAVAHIVLDHSGVSHDAMTKEDHAKN